MKHLPLLAAILVFIFVGIECQQYSKSADSKNKQQVEQSSTSSTRPYEKNPRYWQYNDEPVLLLGGSVQDNLFQVPGVEEQLNTLVSSGGNYVRNTMSSRDEGDVWEFQKDENGKYDLAQLNKEYFQKFEQLLKLAHERNVIVQIELWDRFDFAREPWLSNPFRPANNINYSSEEIGLQNEYPQHPGKNKNPFFRSVPAQNDNQQLLQYQQKRINRILDISLNYPNVLYTMDNETNANPDWGAYWSRFIKKKAEAAGVEVQTTEMWDAWDLKHEEHKRTLDHPELYDFVDISQNSHNTNQEHWDNLQWARNYISDELRPLNNVKIYGSNEGEYGTQTDALERFWRNIIGGAASARFHRPSSGIGLSKTAQINISSARSFASRFNLFIVQPDSTSRLLGERSSDEAYLSFNPGEAYAIYFTDGGSVSLDLRETPGTFSLTWLQIDTNSWSAPRQVNGSGWLQLAPNGPGQWIALVERK